MTFPRGVGESEGNANITLSSIPFQRSGIDAKSKILDAHCEVDVHKSPEQAICATGSAITLCVWCGCPEFRSPGQCPSVHESRGVPTALLIRSCPLSPCTARLISCLLLKLLHRSISSPFRSLSHNPFAASAATQGNRWELQGLSCQVSGGQLHTAQDIWHSLPLTPGRLCASENQILLTFSTFDHISHALVFCTFFAIVAGFLLFI